MVTSVRSTLTQGHMTAAHGSFTRIRQMAPMCTPSKTWLLGPTRVCPPQLGREMQTRYTLKSATLKKVFDLSIVGPKFMRPHVARHQQLSIDICCPRPTSAANPPAAAVVDRWDRHTDNRPFYYAYCILRGKGIRAILHKRA